MRLSKVLTIFGFSLLLSAAGIAAERSAAFRIEDRVENRVDDRLFGQFLEIASWGEPGPEALVEPKSGRLPPPIVEKLRDLRAPVIRFPGGIDIDYLDWTDRIDNAPQRAPGAPRPVSRTRGNELTNRFGYDEFLALAATLNSDPLLVVNLRRSLEPGADVAAAAEHAAALVAYCNAVPTDTRLDPAMREWAELRQANGHKAPWRVRYWQVGNETWNYLAEVAEKNGLRDAETIGRWYVDRLVAYAEAMRRVDSELVLIADGWYIDEAVRDQILTDPRLGRHYDYYALHTYAPGGPVRLYRDGEPIEPDAVSREELWYAWVGMPGHFSEGRVYAKGPGAFVGEPRLGWAITEWNWNGWGAGIQQHGRLATIAQGVGAAGYLNAMIRHGDHLQLATQSMMLGVSWNIAAVEADADAEHEPFLTPSGATTALYTQYHGDRRLAVTPLGATPEVTRNLTLVGWGRHDATEPLPLIDTVVTRSDDRLFLHVLQRSLTDAISLRFDLSSLAMDSESATVRQLRPRHDRGVAPRDVLSLIEQQHPMSEGVLTIELVPQTVSIIEIAL
ncbi:MAG: hypothetical protein AAF266_06745 [Planctomycetota bacterium]